MCNAKFSRQEALHFRNCASLCWLICHLCSLLKGLCYIWDTHKQKNQVFMCHNFQYIRKVVQSFINKSYLELNKVIFSNKYYFAITRFQL